MSQLESMCLNTVLSNRASLPKCMPKDPPFGRHSEYVLRSIIRESQQGELSSSTRQDLFRLNTYIQSKCGRLQIS